MQNRLSTIKNSKPSSQSGLTFLQFLLLLGVIGAVVTALLRFWLSKT